MSGTPRRARRSEYSRYHGGPDPLAPPVDLAEALQHIGEDVMAGYSPERAMREFLRRGGENQRGLDELAREGIRVVAVAPGLVHTPMVHKHVAHLTPEIWAQIEACHPLGMGRPDDVASAVAFLASTDARWITGVTLPLGWAHHYPLPTGQLMAGQ